LRFWDSSAVVPLVVGQPASAEVERWMGEDAEAVTWTPGPAEQVDARAHLEQQEPACTQGEEHERVAQD
jgi:hypothetical protein